jgi:hypothetical protein
VTCLPKFACCQCGGTFRCSQVTQAVDDLQVYCLECAEAPGLEDEDDAVEEAERRYFEKFDGGWQADVQGYTSSP